MAARVIEADELLDLADKLGDRSAGPGKPRTIEQRRAISSAYYALFHKLCQHTAQRLCGRDSWTPEHSTATRWIAHTDLATLADAANGRGNAALRKVLGQVPTELADLAQNFVDLQAARHQADYDDNFDVSKAITMQYVSAARESVEAANRLFNRGDVVYDRFLGLAIGSVRIAKSR